MKMYLEKFQECFNNNIYLKSNVHKMFSSTHMKYSIE